MLIEFPDVSETIAVRHSDSLPSPVLVVCVKPLSFWAPSDEVHLWTFNLNILKYLIQTINLS